MPEPTIYVRVKGGLGNQLFQYATAYALAKRKNCSLKFELEYFLQDPQREFELDTFGIGVAKATAAEVAHFGVGQKWRRTIGKKISRRQAFLPKGLYVEPHFHFASQVALLEPPVLIDGYWQSERYFADIADELRATFAQPKEPSPDFLAKRDRIAGLETAISVHVRRHHSFKSASKTNGSCTPDYYQRAVRHMLTAHPGATCVIFSDDPDYAGDMLSFAPDRIVIDGDWAMPADDLCLMAACNHHIVANSSFSWWGAWLNPQAEKTVIAPRLWFSHEYLLKHSTYDLYPDGWFTLG